MGTQARRTRGAILAASCLLATALTVAWLSGCIRGTEAAATATATPEQCEGCCIADPVPHCVKMYGCADWSECPSGTECTPVSFADCVSSCCGPPELATRCLLPEPGADYGGRLALGFRVPLLELAADPELSSVFEWSAPAEAIIVKCTLFGCAPEVDSEDDRLTIVNFERCALASREFEASVGGFDILDEEALEPHTPVEQSCTPADAGAQASSRKLTTLLVGCWAYDETRLIRASELLPVSAADVGERFSEELIQICTLYSDGLSCPRDDGSFGTCSAGACRRRCLRNEDCQSAEAPGGAGGGGGAGGSGGADGGGGAGGGGGVGDPVCCIESGQRVGVCLIDTTTATCEPSLI